MNLPNSPSEFDPAVFTVSLDFELMWGTVDRPYAEKFHSLCAAERRQVVGRLLDLFEEYDIAATWAIVGHLFLNQGETGETARATAPRQGAADLYYAPDLVDRIRHCRVEQEIGSHTFCHIEMPESKCSRAAAEADVAEVARIARRWGIDMRTLIFPRNLVGHLDVLKRYGFSCYRGPEPHWYAGQPRIVRRVGHLLDIAAAKTPPSVMPQEESGIWNIPGSMLYTPSFGSRRYVPVWMRVLRAKRGLDHAVKQKQIFHLWFHPTDVVCRMDAMLDGLRRIFDHAARLRESGKLVVRPMRDLIPASAGAECDSAEAVLA